MDGEYGLMMTTRPHGDQDIAAGEPASWAAMSFNEVWTGQEYQAAQMIDEGLTEIGLIVTGAIRDRYDGSKCNPYNEIEYGDHTPGRWPRAGCSRRPAASTAPES